MEQIQQIKRAYSDIMQDIEFLLNSSQRGKKSNNTLYPLLNELYVNYGYSLSKEYLRDLITNKEINKSQKVIKLLNKDKLKVTPTLKLTTEWTATKKRTFIIDYGCKNFVSSITHAESHAYQTETEQGEGQNNIRYVKYATTTSSEFIKKSGKTYHIINLG